MPRPPTTNLLPSSVPPELAASIMADAGIGSSQVDAELARINRELNKVAKLSQQAKERSPDRASYAQRRDKPPSPGSMSPDRRHLARRQLQPRRDSTGSPSPRRGADAGTPRVMRDDEGAAGGQAPAPAPALLPASAEAASGDVRGRPKERAGGRDARRTAAPARDRESAAEAIVPENHFPMPLAKSTIEAALHCTVKGHSRRRHAASVASTLSGMSVLKEKWTQPPPLYLEDVGDGDGDCSPRSLPGEISREASKHLPALARRPSSSRAPQKLHKQSRDYDMNAHMTALERRLEEQTKATNMLLSRVMAQETLEAKYVVPPEMGPPIGEHMRANDDSYWYKAQRERRDAIAADNSPARRMPKLQKKRDAERKRSQSPVRGASPERTAGGWVGEGVGDRAYSSAEAATALEEGVGSSEESKEWGLKWEEVPEEKVKKVAKGTPLSNVHLAAALNNLQFEFTKHEMLKWKVYTSIHPLRDDSYIKVGDRYFRPAGTPPQKEVPKWKKVNWWKVGGRKDAVRPFDEEDYQGGYSISRTWRRIRTAEGAVRCTPCRAAWCCLFVLFCAAFITGVVFYFLLGLDT